MIDIKNDTSDYHLDSNPWSCSNGNMPCLADTFDECVEPLDRRSFLGDPIVAHFILVA
jgi:hypothetical protein